MLVAAGGKATDEKSGLESRLHSTCVVKSMKDIFTGINTMQNLVFLLG